jgi:hypothetical protein
MISGMEKMVNINFRALEGDVQQLRSVAKEHFFGKVSVPMRMVMALAEIIPWDDVAWLAFKKKGTKKEEAMIEVLGDILEEGIRDRVGGINTKGLRITSE